MGSTDTGWDAARIARAWAELMRRLGYERYGAQGGDYGSLISPALGRVVPDKVIGVHVNALADAATATGSGQELTELSEADRAKAIANQVWWYGRNGYATQMALRLQTIAYALNDSPGGQLAWNLEWFVDWDPTATDQAPVDRDVVLTNVTTYWLTGTAGSAARIYRASGASWGSKPAPSGVPTAVANFQGDRAVRGLAEWANTIVRWNEYPVEGTSLHSRLPPNSSPISESSSASSVDSFAEPVTLARASWDQPSAVSRAAARSG
ncbi:alpha/beta fold hydrolase [Nocardia sp. CNY236]|uniref:alpha/beta fold hydrolase n=1 Tax=Nocardia sp. CNY236 TaxID=1169152 RepID=UPI00041C820F|nr:hypothetical protein [Nocardia sp. CNY236]